MGCRIHVVSPVGGIGNKIDLDLVAPLLRENGFDVTEYPVLYRNRRALYGKVARHLLSFRGRYDVNLFLGPLFPEWLPFARKNFWMPNPEGFHEHHRRHLPRVDHVLAKTRLTEQLFSKLGLATTYVGFTSRDHLDRSMPRDPVRFFHARSSSFKGTEPLLHTWQAHPEWPELVAVISDLEILPHFSAPNVRIIRRFVSDAELLALQNQHRFHLCCSDCEGFGHYIMEAMGCGAVVLTTDAPPMNELIQPGRGLLVAHLRETTPKGLSQRTYFDPASLAQQVERAIAMTQEQTISTGAAARAFFEQNDSEFRARFAGTLRSLVGSL